MPDVALSQEQIAFIEARRGFTICLWETFAEVRLTGFPESRWDYNLLGRTGQKIAGHEQHEIARQQVQVKATFSQNDKDYLFMLCLTNSPTWDLVITIRTGLGSDRILVVHVPYDRLTEASEEVRSTLWHSLAIVGRARKSTSSHCAPKPNISDWVRQLSRFTTNLLPRREG